MPTTRSTAKSSTAYGLDSSEQEFDQGDREQEEEEVHQVGDKDVESDKSDSDEDHVLLDDCSVS